MHAEAVLLFDPICRGMRTGSAATAGPTCPNGCCQASHRESGAALSLTKQERREEMGC